MFCHNSNLDPFAQKKKREEKSTIFHSLCLLLFPLLLPPSLILPKKIPRCALQNPPGKNLPETTPSPLSSSKKNKKRKTTYLPKLLPLPIPLPPSSNLNLPLPLTPSCRSVLIPSPFPLSLGLLPLSLRFPGPILHISPFCVFPFLFLSCRPNCAIVVGVVIIGGYEVV